jgi:purine-binding chemotaxis protein CheW
MVMSMEDKVENTLKNDSSDNDFTEKYLTFFIEEQIFAVKSSSVIEIIRMQPITFMPKLPPYVKGVINLRGKIVPLIDLRIKLGKEPKEYDEHTSIVVLDTNDTSVGFIVDRVNDVTDIAKSRISDSPKLAKDSDNNYVTGIATLDSEVAMILNPVSILTENSDEIKEDSKMLHDAVHE